MKQPVPTSWMTFSERVYRALLVLYPPDYRCDYDALMVQFFRDVSQERYRRQGAVGVMLWWCRTLIDLTLTVIEQRRKAGSIVSKATFIQLTGIFLIVGGALSAGAAVSQLQPGDHYSYSGIYQFAAWLFMPGSMLVGLGCIGLALRYGSTAGTLMQWTLLLTGIGALLMGAGTTATLIQPPLRNLFSAGALIHVVSLTGFGLLHLRQPILSVFRALPLQMASGWLVMLPGFIGLFPPPTNNLLMFLFAFGLGVGWLGIGQSVQRQPQNPTLAAA